MHRHGFAGHMHILIEVPDLSIVELEFVLAALSQY